jgi:4-amino-4-deoxy-L-arabinose transferase-like glycosyltransferase
MVEPRSLDWRVLRAVAVVFLLARLALFLVAHPFMDETYYWMWGQHPALSYFDHPALIGWTQGLASLFGWNVVALRLFPLLTFCADLVLLWLLAKRTAGEKWRDSFWTTAAVFMSAPIFVLLTGSALPDHLLLCFSLLTVYAVESLRQTGKAGWLYLAGLSIGLAMLSKYTGALLGAGLVIYLLATPPLRPLFRSPHLYLAALIALALQLPVLIWNLQNDLASFGFIVDGRSGLGGNGTWWTGLGGYLAGAVAVLSPMLAVVMVRFGVGRRNSLGFPRLVFWLSTLAFLVASLFTNILIHWNAVAYIVVLPFLWPLLRTRWLMILQLVYGAVAIGAAAFNFAVMPIAATYTVADQTSSWSYGWGEVVAEINTLRQTQHVDFIAASDYALASPLAFALHDPGVTSLSPRREEYDYWFDPEAHRGQSALIVADRWRGLDAGSHFASVTELTQVHIIRFGHAIGHYRIYLGTGYIP